MVMSRGLRLFLCLSLSVGALVYGAHAHAGLSWGNAGSKCAGTQRVDFARLWGLAPGTDWVGICRRTKAAGVSGRANGKVPSTCAQHADGSVWGEWKFSNHASCKPTPPPAQKLTWGDVGSKCDNGALIEYARLWGLKPGQDWVGICRRTKASDALPSSAGKVPSTCVQHVDGSVWGEWKYSGHASCAPRWGAFKKDDCVRRGYRQYSSRIWEAGANPMQTCARTPATINGQRIAAPARCKSAVDGGVWGEFDVPDASCPFWGNETGQAGLVKGDCAAVEIRKYYARLWDIEAGADWFGACHAETANVVGITTGPSRCVNKGPLGMWGEWLVKDTSCTIDKLPQDARREAIARAKLEEIRDVILANLNLAANISQDRAVASAVKGGNPSTIAQSARASQSGARNPEGGESESTGSFPRTITVGAVTSGKVLIIGGSAEAGAAVDWAGRRPVYAYASAGYNWGPGLAAGAGVNVGFWVCQNNKIGGDGWGWTFGLADLGMALLEKNPFGKGPDVAVGLWWTPPAKDDPPGTPDTFAGFTITPGFGVGADFVGLNFVTTAVDGDETVECDGSPKS